MEIIRQFYDFYSGKTVSINEDCHDFDAFLLLWNSIIWFLNNQCKKQDLFMSKIYRNTFLHIDKNPQNVSDFWRFRDIFVPIHLLLIILTLEYSFQNAKVWVTKNSFLVGLDQLQENHGSLVLQTRLGLDKANQSKCLVIHGKKYVWYMHTIFFGWLHG